MVGRQQGLGPEPRTAEEEVEEEEEEVEGVGGGGGGGQPLSLKSASEVERERLPPLDNLCLYILMYLKVLLWVAFCILHITVLTRTQEVNSTY